MRACKTSLMFFTNQTGQCNSLAGRIDYSHYTKIVDQRSKASFFTKRSTSL